MKTGARGQRASVFPTWESYREELARQAQRSELLDAAVAAIVEMGNNSYQRHLNQKQADAIEDFISFDGGDRTELCREVWDAAKPRIYSGWQDGTWKALEELRTEELYGQSYSSSLGR